MNALMGIFSLRKFKKRPWTELAVFMVLMVLMHALGALAFICCGGLSWLVLGKLMTESSLDPEIRVGVSVLIGVVVGYAPAFLGLTYLFCKQNPSVVPKKDSDASKGQQEVTKR